eukprot:23997-Pleurochrysis_carterae.AAC.1
MGARQEAAPTCCLQDHPIRLRTVAVPAAAAATKHRRAVNLHRQKRRLNACGELWLLQRSQDPSLLPLSLALALARPLLPVLISPPPDTVAPALPHPPAQVAFHSALPAICSPKPSRTGSESLTISNRKSLARSLAPSSSPLALAWAVICTHACMWKRDSTRLKARTSRGERGELQLQTGGEELLRERGEELLRGRG